MADEITVTDPIIQTLLKELPNWQKYIQQERKRIIDQANLAQRVFGDAVAELLKDRETEPQDKQRR